MQGKVLSYDDNSATGLISGDDGRRYGFTRGDLKDGRLVAPGAEVDFVADGERATNVYVLGGGGQKSKIAAALLAFFLGGFGVHKFYLGKTGPGVIMLLCGTIGWLLIAPALIIWLVAFIEFIVYLVKSDADFHRDYVVGNRGWF